MLEEPEEDFDGPPMLVDIRLLFRPERRAGWWRSAGCRRWERPSSLATARLPVRLRLHHDDPDRMARPPGGLVRGPNFTTMSLNIRPPPRRLRHRPFLDVSSRSLLSRMRQTSRFRRRRSRSTRRTRRTSGPSCNSDPAASSPQHVLLVGFAAVRAEVTSMRVATAGRSRNGYGTASRSAGCRSCPGGKPLGRARTES